MLRPLFNQSRHAPALRNSTVDARCYKSPFKGPSLYPRSRPPYPSEPSQARVSSGSTRYPPVVTFQDSSSIHTPVDRLLAGCLARDATFPEILSTPTTSTSCSSSSSPVYINMKDPVARTASPYSDPTNKGPKSQAQASHQSDLRKMVYSNVNKTPLHPGGVAPHQEHTELEEELHETAHIDYDRVAIVPNASVPALYEDALVYETGSAITSSGALTAYSGKKTGRSPLDKLVYSNVNKTPLHPGGVAPHQEHTELEEELHETAHIDYDRVAIVPNASVPALYEDALVYETGSAITSSGALTAYSGKKTGRSPLDKRIVEEPSSKDDIWWGPVNKPMTPEVWKINRERAVDYLNTRNRIYVVDGFAGWDEKYRIRTIGLSAEKEPDIFGAIRFGSVLENVVFDPETRAVDYDDSTLTENTRCAYPIEYISNAKIPCISDSHPTNIILLTCDARGVLPPISKLDRSQTMFHFISGYTSKMAGTEDGVTEPQATFSSCFAQPFLALHPMRYAKMLADKIETHKANAWLLNTGWVGAGATQGGKRCPLKYTRAILDAIHSGELANVEYENYEVFNLQVPKTCPNVPSELLNPSNAWTAGAESFSTEVKKLGALFVENFKKYESEATEDVIKAGPVI
ncbi:hypothetical protein BN1708_004979, partial [Verticillium longisporum]